MYSKELEKGYLEKKVDLSLDLFQEIKYLQQKKNAVILAHYYQNADIQDIADYIGDSLGLAQEAQKSKADIIFTLTNQIFMIFLSNIIITTSFSQFQF